MPKFFVKPEKVSENNIVIDTEDVNHIKRVLRLQEGDVINVCDTAGFDYDAKITDITDKAIVCRIIGKKKTDTESNLCVTLYQGIPKGSKMDYIIEKTTELGITGIVPVMMSRCVVRLDGKKEMMKKQERWQKIAVAAAKQSGRGIIPEVAMPVTFAEAIEKIKKEELAITAYECEEDNKLRPLLEKNKACKNIGIMIGPEGGFDIKEIKTAEAAEINVVTLGKRILRTETAGEAMLAMVMYENGDINQ